ncbi:class I SAM-dependent methyltransferase [bacterium]|nr:class I SAM-dependent methyltransferase [bacterium]
MIPELRDRIRKRYKHLKKWATKNKITCYRLYEKDLPDHPLIIDFYDGYALVWARGRKRDVAPAERSFWLQNVWISIIDALGIDESKLIIKKRISQSGHGQHEKQDDSSLKTVITENDLKFEVNLTDYLDTGLFLDHRPLRNLIMNSSNGLNVLNLFCYTGSFTVSAAAGGASNTCSIDLSKTYLSWLKKNLVLNKLMDSQKHEIIQGDCIKLLENMNAKKLRFDIIICDPPTFSNSKKTLDDFIIQNDHTRLLSLCEEMLTENGVIYFSTNFRGFKLSEEISNSMSIIDISNKTIPEDFRNKRIHSCWKISKK